ncbi:MAG: hypothetical protein NC355_08360 [Blautia sp.]|nr:hypothetical protein [Blautia sp.]
MQIGGNAAVWGQMDFAPEADYGNAPALLQDENNITLETGRESDTGIVRQEEEQESYEPSEAGLLLYFEQLKNAKQNSTQRGSDDEMKALRIAHNIMRGLKVPAKDESFLLSKNFKMYMAAKNMASMKECSGEAASVLGDDSSASGSTSGNSASPASGSVPQEASAPGSASAAVLGSGSAEKNSAVASGLASGNAAEVDYSALLESVKAISKNNISTGMSVSRYVKKSKYSKRFYYNFKQISAQILSAKTSSNAKQVLIRARQKTVQIRRKWKYDDQSLQAALVHAEAMERVAKKKMRHLQEEEAAAARGQGLGGVCAGDTDEEDRMEQEWQDEQMLMEKQAEEASPVYTMATDTSVPLEDVNLEELMAEAMQTPVLDLTASMEELMDEFSDMMEETLEDMGLDELADSLSSGRELDPADLDELKRKHRQEEQQAIAEADSKYLRAFFQKLQQEREAVASGAAKIAAAVNSGARVLSLTSGATTSGRSGAVSAAPASSVSTASSAPAAEPGTSTGSPAGAVVSASTVVAAVAVEGASIDVSL